MAKTVHCVSHVDYTDASMVVTICGDVYHVNDPDIELLDESAFKECLPWFCCSDCERELQKGESND